MDKDNQNLNKKGSSRIGIVHILLSHDYAIFFFAIVLGVVVDQIFNFNFFDRELYQYIGLIMIVLGSLLIYWAQSTTSPSKPEVKKERDFNFFFRGPYKYTRNPTNLGLTTMSIGLGFLINSVFSIVFIVITYLISRFIFIRKQDSILEERYGSIFADYKKKVKDWL